MVETVRAVMDRLEAQQAEEVEIPPNGISLDLLQAVYRNNRLPLPTRMRAAGMAIPYECAKLMATAVINENSFAELLEKRLKRQQQIEQAKVIEADKSTPTVEVKPPLPRLPDRRYRRI